MYTYRATVLEVYDGDTITVELDLGFNVFLKEKIRLFGINTPEVTGIEKEEGIVSRDALRDIILGKEVIIKTLKDKKGKYGRYLGIVYLGNVSINEILVLKGLAVQADY